MPLPRIILTTGEPAGIGPDLTLAIAGHSLDQQGAFELVIAGDRDLLEARAQQLKLSVRCHEYHREQPRPHQPHEFSVLHVPVQHPVQAGTLDAANASSVLAMLDRACDGCVTGEFDAMVTAPVQKSVINQAGIHFTGHTEYLAERCGHVQPVMMLTAPSLRVALVTTHLPLSQVSAAVTPALLRNTLCIVDRDLRQHFGIQQPRILVLGLNPHAGESGYLGREEIDTIIPVLEELRAEGLHLTGPAPADTAFTPHMLRDADVVLAMYHDQGLPVLKHAGFGMAVNVTLGLPIIRTSVDHGTALDLAGSGRADAGSLLAALELALDMSRHRANTAH